MLASKKQTRSTVERMRKINLTGCYTASLKKKNYKQLLREDTAEKLIFRGMCITRFNPRLPVIEYKR